MNKKEYKKAVDEIQPDDSLREKVWQGLGNKSSIFSNFKIYTVAITLVISVVSLSMLNNLTNTNEKYKFSKSKIAVPESQNKVEEFKKTKGSFNGITIPKYEMQDSSKKSNESMYNASLDWAGDEIGFFVYQGRVYLQNTGAKFSAETGRKLTGGKLGITLGLHDNADVGGVSKEIPHDTKDLYSNLGGIEVYSVKGYDPAVRLIGYTSGGSRLEFYDCWNGITIYNGSEMFGKLNLLGNIKTATWETSQSSLNGDIDQQSIKLNETFENMINGLNHSVPISTEELSIKNIFDENDQKVVILTLNNGIEEKLYFFKKQRLVLYTVSHVYFKVDDEIFDKFYESLK